MRRAVEPDAKQPARARRSRSRTLAFALALCAFLVLALEAAALLAYALLPGPGFSRERLAAARATRARLAPEPGGTAAPLAFQDSGGDTCIHPYLGFVANRDTDDQMLFPARGYGVTRYGFVDDEDPVHRRDPRTVLIGIFGGSVAQFFSAEGAEELARRLRAHPAYAGRRIEFVRLGIGGFKQPQQLFALTWLFALGGELDIAINLDGFNEATLGPLENVPRGVADVFPRNWALLAEHAPDPTERRLMGTVTVLRDVQRSLAATVDRRPWRWSILANLLWEQADRWLDRAAGQRLLALQDRRRDHLPFHVTGPGADGAATPEEQSAAAIATWQRCSRAMHDVCAARGIRYFHFLQPNQYVPGSKPLSDEELAGAFDPESRYRPWIERGYPGLQRAGAELAASGVRFVDLTRLFADVRDTVYIDVCCHFNAAGNRRIAQAIAAAILAEESENATPPVPPATLRVDPPAVTLTQPFARAELRVVGTRPGGETVDVTYWAATSYASSDPRVVTVDEYGTLTAITHGDATVTVACGEQRATVAVAVRLPPVADLGGAWAPPSLRRPVLRGTVADGKAVLRVTPPGPGLPGAVVFAFEPAARAFCGGTVFVPLHGGGAAPLAASAGEVEVTLPPDFERGTVYTQAIYGTGGDVCGYAISNGLAIRL